MSEYQVIARRFRPKSFKEVIGQDAIVATLKNAISSSRLAQAYLFCGPRGTGKTTLARILAKALNCAQRTTDCEPCNACTSCREITSGSSLNVLEIDGASHRGIEDIRQINETVSYASASGQYKIYIIDEVHMLTKEAFNALLKTLEEPPPKVIFLFATTEPHKVLPTILSRCQRFNLNRIPLEKMIQKLQMVANNLGIEIEEEALHMIAQRAEGGLRDAESLLDQMMAFEEGKITVASVSSILGIMSRDAYFELDRAGKEGQFIKAFEIAHQIFSQGKDLTHFVEGLIEHFRHLLLVKLAGSEALFLSIAKHERAKYEASAQYYTQEQCLTLIEDLIEAQSRLRVSSSSHIALEAILLHIIRSHYRLPIELLVHRLSQLESAVSQASLTPAVSSSIPQQVVKPVNQALKSKPLEEKFHQPLKLNNPATTIVDASISEDPTPMPADLGIKKEKPIAGSSTQSAQAPVKIEGLQKPSYYYDTLLQFAAVELEGRIQRNGY